VLLRHTTAINHYTSLNLTKLDVLDGFKTIDVAAAYHTTDLDGNKKTWRDRLPADLTQLEDKNCEVENVTLQGWNSDITQCKTWEDLPQQAREYIEFIEKQVGVPIKWVGVGPGRDAMITRF
jgi:adenylosuccinate synthase